MDKDRRCAGRVDTVAVGQGGCRELQLKYQCEVQKAAWHSPLLHLSNVASFHLHVQILRVVSQSSMDQAAQLQEPHICLLFQLHSIHLRNKLTACCSLTYPLHPAKPCSTSPPPPLHQSPSPPTLHPKPPLIRPKPPLVCPKLPPLRHRHPPLRPTPALALAGCLFLRLAASLCLKLNTHTMRQSVMEKKRSLFL